MLRTAVAVVALGLLVPQVPSLDTVLSRAGEYVAALHHDCPVVVAEESSTQLLRIYGSTHRDMFASGAPLGEVGERKVRKMRSEVVLVADAAASAWPAYRDVFEIDGKPVRDKKNRLETIFAAGGGGGSAALAAITAEAVRQQLGSMNRTINSPTFALLPVLPAHQPRFTFKKKGEKKVEGVTAWVVGYTETQGPMLTKTADGVPQPIRGEIWIDPATGRVLRTHVVFDTLDAYPDMKEHPERYREFPRSTIDVTFKLQPSVNAWLPAEVTEIHDRSSEVTNWTATYSSYRRLLSQ